MLYNVLTVHDFYVSFFDSTADSYVVLLYCPAPCADASRGCPAAGSVQEMGHGVCFLQQRRLPADAGSEDVPKLEDDVCSLSCIHFLSMVRLLSP